MFADNRHDSVHSELGRLLREPFVTVNVLGRTHRHGQIIRMSAPVLMCLLNPGLRPFRRIHHQSALVHRPMAVNDIDTVAGTMPENPDAMRGFLFSESANASVDVFRPENFHCSTL